MTAKKAAKKAATKKPPARPKAAVGIHDHPTRKLGVRPRDPSRPAIAYSAIRSGKPTAGPVVPVAFDDTPKVEFGLDGNDRFGVCVPTGFDNFCRMVSLLLAGTQVSATSAQIFAWYREQNPDFDPATGAGDGGMNIQMFLEARVKAGDILAFAAVDHTNEDEVREAMYLFLGLIAGVDLQVAQQAQTDAHPPIWDYKKSGVWGGHCILEAGKVQPSDDEEAVSWAELVLMTQAFLAKQRSELWVVVTHWHVANPRFREGVDLSALASEYTRLTDRPFPVIGPAPVPTPTPTGDADHVLAAAVEDWIANHRHTGEAETVAKALIAWKTAKGL